MYLGSEPVAGLGAVVQHPLRSVEGLIADAVDRPKPAVSLQIASLDTVGRGGAAGRFGSRGPREAHEADSVGIVDPPVGQLAEDRKQFGRLARACPTHKSEGLHLTPTFPI